MLTNWEGMIIFGDNLGKSGHFRLASVHNIKPTKKSWYRPSWQCQDFERFRYINSSLIQRIKLFLWENEMRVAWFVHQFVLLKMMSHLDCWIVVINVRKLCPATRVLGWIIYQCFGHRLTFASAVAQSKMFDMRKKRKREMRWINCLTSPIVIECI